MSQENLITHEQLTVDSVIQVGIKVEYFICSFFMGICNSLINREDISFQAFYLSTSTVFIAVEHYNFSAVISVSCTDDFGTILNRKMVVYYEKFTLGAFLIDYAQFNRKCSEALVIFINEGWKVHYNKFAIGKKLEFGLGLDEFTTTK